jgi:hypothetical protein
MKWNKTSGVQQQYRRRPDDEQQMKGIFTKNMDKSKENNT